MKGIITKWIVIQIIVLLIISSVTYLYGKELKKEEEEIVGRYKTRNPNDIIFDKTMTYTLYQSMIGDLHIENSLDQFPFTPENENQTRYDNNNYTNSFYADCQVTTNSSHVTDENLVWMFPDPWDDGMRPMGSVLLTTYVNITHDCHLNDALFSFWLTARCDDEEYKNSQIDFKMKSSILLPDKLMTDRLRDTRGRMMFSPNETIRVGEQKQIIFDFNFINPSTWRLNTGDKLLFQLQYWIMNPIILDPIQNVSEENVPVKLFLIYGGVNPSYYNISLERGIGLIHEIDYSFNEPNEYRYCFIPPINHSINKVTLVIEGLNLEYISFYSSLSMNNGDRLNKSWVYIYLPYNYHPCLTLRFQLEMINGEIGSFKTYLDGEPEQRYVREGKEGIHDDVMFLLNIVIPVFSSVILIQIAYRYQKKKDSQKSVKSENFHD